MTLLEEIEAGAASDDMPIGTLLRKLLILVSRLGSKPAEEWVEWELNGYPDDSPVPPYRVLSLVIKVNLVDIAKRIEGWTVPPALLGKTANDWTQIRYRQSVGAIEHFLCKGATADAVHFSAGNLLLHLNRQKFTEMNIMSAWAEAGSSQLKNILESVRNRVLKFVLELDKEYPLAGTVKSPGVKTTERVDQMFINNIYGSANVVGTANNSNIVLNVVKGDFASLEQTLVSSGAAPADIGELRVALEAEPTASSAGFGPMVSAWIGKMMSRAADGSWQIAAGAAGNLLSTAVARYYGF